MPESTTADWRATDLLDDDGAYPTVEALDLIRTFPGTPRELIEAVLTPIFAPGGFVRTEPGTDDLGRVVIRVSLVTGGWSGCEDAIGALDDSMFWFAWWRSSRRGGGYEFAVPADQWDEPMIPLPARLRVLDDTVDVAEMMRAFGQEVRTAPTTDISDAERLLRARLVFEEALEFVEAMGCVATTPGHDVVEKDSVEVQVDPRRALDLVEATDALGDLIVVTKGSALTLGVPLDAAVEVIHGTNMAKLGPDGKPIRRADGKVVKPGGWQPPTESLRALLLDRGWDEAGSAVA